MKRFGDHVGSSFLGGVEEDSLVRTEASARTEMNSQALFKFSLQLQTLIHKGSKDRTPDWWEVLVSQSF
eukprot:5423050-Amphidinium_carterae.1